MLGAQPPPLLPTSPFGWVPRTSRVLGGAGAELAHPMCPKTPGGAQGNALGELEEEHSVPLASSKPSHAPEAAHQKKTKQRITKLPRKRPEVLGDQTAQPQEGTAGSSAPLQAHTQRGRPASTAWAPTPSTTTTPLGFAKPVARKRQQQGPRRPLSLFLGKYTRFRQAVRNPSTVAVLYKASISMSACVLSLNGKMKYSGGPSFAPNTLLSLLKSTAYPSHAPRRDPSTDTCCPCHTPAAAAVLRKTQSPKTDSPQGRGKQQKHVGGVKIPPARRACCGKRGRRAGEGECPGTRKAEQVLKAS